MKSRNLELHERVNPYLYRNFRESVGFCTFSLNKLIFRGPADYFKSFSLLRNDYKLMSRWIEINGQEGKEVRRRSPCSRYHFTERGTRHNFKNSEEERRKKENFEVKKIQDLRIVKIPFLYVTFTPHSK